MSVTVKLEGADTLRTKLKAYLVGAPKRVQGVISTTLLEIESDAKNLAPVDTGLLRSTIHANLTGKFAGSVSTDARYAIHVEYGTGRMRAQPFLRPAYALHKQAFLSDLKAALKFRI